MIYLSIQNKAIRLMCVSKALMGSSTLQHFHKIFEGQLLENLSSPDILASAIKEALTLAKPNEITDAEVTLILPQDKFKFLRFDVPADIAPRAVSSFLKDKLKNENHINIDEANVDFLTTTIADKTVAVAYVLPSDTLHQIQEIFRLIGLKLSVVLPDTLCYYTLFSKTLRDDKVENIFFAVYDSMGSHLYEYDSMGLMTDGVVDLGANPPEKLKSLVEGYEKQGKKVHRIILSGPMSKSVRQDLFTKEVGAWTNPLERIILNFYHTYIKSISAENLEDFSILQYDSCLGAFIFTSENKTFSLMNSNSASYERVEIAPNKIFSGSSKAGKSRNFELNKRFFLILFATILLTMGLVIAWKRSDSLIAMIPSKVTPTEVPTAEPTPSPTPTPSVNKETLKIKVLNGGGVKGKANEVKSALKAKGYGDIVTANASSFDIEKSTIEVNKGNMNIGNLIQKDLASLVENAPITESSASGSADIIFTMGRDLK